MNPILVERRICLEPLVIFEKVVFLIKPIYDIPSSMHGNTFTYIIIGWINFSLFKPISLLVLFKNFVFVVV